MKGTLYTSYFSKLKQGKGIKISIARFNPKWLKPNDINFTFINLAPSKELLNNYKYNNLSWEEYSKEYYDFILNYNKSKHEISLIESYLNQGLDVTVYCYEKSGDNCHRHLLAEIFKEKNFEIKEI